MPGRRRIMGVGRPQPGGIDKKTSDAAGLGQHAHVTQERNSCSM